MTDKQGSSGLHGRVINRRGAQMRRVKTMIDRLSVCVGSVLAEATKARVQHAGQVRSQAPERFEGGWRLGARHGE
ncbi:hypothetical protein C1Y08_09735 [Pseudomonas sp. FW306-02-F02-AA]|uniref:Uncharacterized protein n=1 Tax=Pseudomonas fluorescens TaxID=294 RepID=A0A0N9VLC4_PSEFL|nr:hypothetical protein AO353_06190 [Pseudomonas fluorescens]PMZ04560.1 hypothetical protein C1Y07_09590 [Pseudomonas sp. FW306-02-F02-AB]PMZ16287.1 hypothetical protein C1Y08_09735 [Pseudomonas sp. FW306-02-F02-AA]PMZ22229.1 hypothetical protein C1Y09_10280 [Pseudomonas sp. FW306-02-F08-AA]PMZ34943.1 hypothetical protein C1X99_09520 [Pseudomonas sp. FW306-02-H06B]PMZ47686.1 hypothetical protein C1Y03_07565 [Pseudomonas sp. FW306-02-H05-AA]PMZ52479.1 hypothetical protein C1Y04_14490 [Pseudomo